jgi:class 3 adenylate cyclase
VHATKVSIFDLAWSLVCPCCGIRFGSHASLNDLSDDSFHCTLCHVDVPSHLDDRVEVSFTISPAIKRPDIEPFGNLQDYWRFFMSNNFVRSKELSEYVDEVRRAAELIEPDDSRQVVFEAAPATLYRLMSPENHAACFIRTSDDRNNSADQTVDVDLLPGGFSPAEVTVDAGRITLNIRNLLRKPIGALLVLTDFERLHAILSDHPSRWLPFFTGKMLLNNQSFRDLFRVQKLVPDLKLRLRSLTILFTDLKGSTALYDRTGDTFAYGLVQEHYRLLSEAVREQSGAVIKTMGDAIMASFSDSPSAVRAAIEMMNRISTFNASLEPDGHVLGLKIGLHEGSALAVNADDRLDYFGQTVNIAARVQALAQAGEIWITEPVFQTDGVGRILDGSGFREEKQLVALKGIGQSTIVYQCSRAG